MYWVMSLPRNTFLHYRLKGNSRDSRNHEMESWNVLLAQLPYSSCPRNKTPFNILFLRIDLFVKPFLVSNLLELLKSSHSRSRTLSTVLTMYILYLR